MKISYLLPSTLLGLQTYNRTYGKFSTERAYDLLKSSFEGAICNAKWVIQKIGVSSVATTDMSNHFYLSLLCGKLVKKRDDSA